MTFKEDLEAWEIVENKVAEAFNREWLKVIKNPDKKWMDLLFIYDGAEVKMDFMASKTWNVYIEYESNWTPSGILKDEDVVLRYWAHALKEDEVLLFDWEIFKEYVKTKIKDCSANKSNTSKWFRIVSWWDWNRTRGLLIPVQEMKSLSTITLKI